jgi:hypothetical protein
VTLDCFRLRSSSYGGQVAEPVIGRAMTGLMSPTLFKIIMLQRDQPIAP